MKWLIGVDEAGYGPNLGPLVVALSAWHLNVPSLQDASTPITGSSHRSRQSRSEPQSSRLTEQSIGATHFASLDLFASLHPDISRCDQATSDTWLRVDDSKRLYSGEHTLRTLERVVLGATHRGIVPRSINQLRAARMLDASTRAERSPTPQQLALQFGREASDDHAAPHALRKSTPTTPCAELWRPIPLDSANEACQELGRWAPEPTSLAMPHWYQSATPLNTEEPEDALREIGRRFEQLQTHHSVQLAFVAARQLEPKQFNQACQRWSNKASVLSLTTLGLVREAIEHLPSSQAGEILCRCDRHGGRSRYAALIQTIFPEAWVEVLEESSQLSRYRFAHASRSIEMRFEVGSERYFETAWASLHAKYLRELAMNEFNSFWQQRCPTLKGTKGYPQDAKRFLSEIREMARHESIDLSDFWRER